MYSSTTPTSHPITTVSHITTPVPSLHAAKSISDRKLSVAIPLATLRVTMETSSTASNNKYGDQQQPQQQQQQQFNQTDDEPRISEESTNISEESTKINDDEYNHVETITQDGSDDAIESEDISEKMEETTSHDQRLKKVLEVIQKYSNNENADSYGRGSILSISDFAKLSSNDKKVKPQIDSDYSNTMHVLGETASIVGGDDARKIKNLRQTNRALY